MFAAKLSFRVVMTTHQFKHNEAIEYFYDGYWQRGTYIGKSNLDMTEVYVTPLKKCISHKRTAPLGTHTTPFNQLKALRGNSHDPDNNNKRYFHLAGMIKPVFYQTQVNSEFKRQLLTIGYVGRNPALYSYDIDADEWTVLSACPADMMKFEINNIWF